ncbi:MAG: sensory rhodopsin transducer [Candidatus Omnitrophica bacterium]|nr:sensory rhodopsin transducer [Candidatus Omnitrophota bacterium]
MPESKTKLPPGNGSKTWVFADGWLPAKSANGSKLESHEALMILNTGSKPANVALDFYFDKQPPIKGVPIRVEAERVVCLRLDHPIEIGGTELPRLSQYALRVRSDANVVVQFGRLDTTQPNLAYYTNVGYSEG